VWFNAARRLAQSKTSSCIQAAFANSFPVFAVAFVVIPSELSDEELSLFRARVSHHRTELLGGSLEGSTVLAKRY
jgi:hypothetical protein